MARQLRDAADTVRRLSRSQLLPVVSPDIELEMLEVQLQELATRIEGVQPPVGAKRPLGRDIFRAALIHYVHQTTRQYHDAHVADLINVTESLSIPGDPNAPAKAGYTEAAHVNWRRRDSALHLLTAPMELVSEAFADLERDLQE
jgi:hypothetical protein